MKNKFLIKIVMLVAMIAAISQTAMSQKVGFAGDDQDVMISEGQTYSIHLGRPVAADMQSDNTTVYFHWRVISHPLGSEGVLDKDDIAQPTLAVSECGKYTCECIRISKYGYQTEYVEINVMEDIEIVSIESNYECYQVGQQLDPSFFTIVTNPIGYEYRVKMADDSTVAKRTGGGSYGPETDEKVNFKVVRDDGTYYTPENAVAEIAVVDNSTKWATATIPLGKTLIDRFNDYIDYIDPIKDQINENEVTKNFSAKPYWTLNHNITLGMSEDCCDYTKYAIGVYDGDIAAEGGFGITYMFPFFPNLSVVGQVGIEGQLDLLGFRIGMPIPTHMCSSFYNASFNVTGYLTIKLMLSVVPGCDVISVSGGGKGYLKLAAKFFPEWTGTFLAGVSVVADVVAFVTLYHGEWTIVESQEKTIW